MSKDYLTGVIDIGSNTIRLNIYRPKKNNDNYKTVISKKTFAGLSAYIIDGKLTDAGIQKTVKILNKIARIIEDLEIDQTYAFATAAIRNAKNEAEVVKILEAETGLSIEVISGEKEGLCSYTGLTLDLGPIDAGYVIDIGGGSTELTLVQKGAYVSTLSIPEGSLSLHRSFVRHIIPSVDEYRMIKSYVVELLSQSPLPHSDQRRAYGVGGTIRAVGNLTQELNHKATNSEVSLAEIEDLSLRYLTQDIESLKTVFKVTPERLHTQLPGMIILQEVMKALACSNLIISRNGVREGYLYNKQKEA